MMDKEVAVFLCLQMLQKRVMVYRMVRKMMRIKR